ncbi:hypothetical protein [Streptosporangium sp. NPDC048865]|uniref:hypothetical protein n=1 Tax=Streptosporangium sp. NPDC048865 TaxID=3155766 RepID=UPI00342CA7BD
MPNWYAQHNNNKIPVLGLVPESGGTEPATPATFQFWGDTGSGKIKWRTPGGAWFSVDDVADGAITDAKVASGANIALSKLATNPLARANHTGTQLASTISDFTTQVRANRLDQMAAPGADVALAGYRLTGLGAPSGPNDAARLADIQAAAAGISVKPAVRAATTGNIALTGLQTIDGITLVAGDRVLVKNQSSAAQNGIYLAATGAWTRTDDALSPNTFVFVSEGSTLADTGWAISTDTAIVPGTTAITWAQFAGGGGGSGGPGAGLVQNGGDLDVVAADGSIVVNTNSIEVGLVPIAKGGTGATTAAAARTALGVGGVYNADLPALTAGVAATVTHSLGTKDVYVAACYDIASGADVELEVTSRPTNDTLTIRSDIAVASGAVRILVRS